MRRKARFGTCYKRKQFSDGGDKRIHIQIDMIAAYFSVRTTLLRVSALPAYRTREIFCPLPRLRTRIFGSHVACVKYTTAKLTSIRGNIARILWLSDDAPGICDDLFVYGTKVDVSL